MTKLHVKQFTFTFQLFDISRLHIIQYFLVGSHIYVKALNFISFNRFRKRVLITYTYYKVSV